MDHKIIDGHAHFIPPEVARHTTFYKSNWSDLGRQIDMMDENNIGKALLLYPTTDAHIQMGSMTQVCSLYNDCLADVIRQYPSRFIGAGILPFEDPVVLERELRRFLDLGLKVISMPSSYKGKYLDDDGFAAIFEFASQYHMPIHVHPQTMNPIGEDRVKDPLLSPVLEYVMDVSICVGKMMMEGTFLKFPDVAFIFAHYGGVLPFVKERFDSTYRMLRVRNLVKDLGKAPSDYFRNIYFDTSGSKSLASLMCALEVTSPQHVIFGSDFPANQDIASAMNVVCRADICEKDKSTILSNPLLKDC